MNYEPMFNWLRSARDRCMSRSRMTCAVALACFSTLPTELPAQNIGDELADFWARTGGSANYTHPKAFLGQQAGFVTGGFLILRTKPRNTNIARLRLPSVRSGCGGIDMYMGSFSFLSADELIALMEAIMQNAPGFAFELALESLSPAIQETVNNLRDLAGKVNAMNVNSCEQSQALVGSLWPKLDNASQHICKTVGVDQGIFADRARSKHGCGIQNAQSATLGSATGELAEQVPVNVNYAWVAIQKHPYLKANPNIAELMMTLTGTVVTREDPTAPDILIHDPYLPKAFSSEMVQGFIEGGTLLLLKCDETTKCLNPSWVDTTIPQDEAFYARVYALVQSLADALVNNTAPPVGAHNLVGLTSTPVFATLVEAISSRYVFVDDEIAIMSELVSIELAMQFMQSSLTEMAEATAKTDIYGDLLPEFQRSIKESLNQFAVVRGEARESYGQALASVQRLKLARDEAAANSTNRFASAVTRN